MGLTIELRNGVWYRTSIPTDIIFYVEDGKVYAQWWNASRELVTVEASQILSIDQ